MSFAMETPAMPCGSIVDHMSFISCTGSNGMPIYSASVTARYKQHLCGSRIEQRHQTPKELGASPRTAEAPSSVMRQVKVVRSSSSISILAVQRVHVRPSDQGSRMLRNAHVES